MSRRGLAALYLAMSEPIGTHLDDETLAVIVDAEMAGQDVEQLYSSELAHIEQCERCASAYSELMLMVETAVEEMAQSMTVPEDITAFDIAAIWRQAFSLTAEKIENQFRLSFGRPTSQFAEPGPVYQAGDDWSFPPIILPSSRPIQVDTALTRLSDDTCRLTIRLQALDDQPLSSPTIEIQYDQTVETAETAPDGSAHFTQIPIAALPSLTITIYI